jgi:hypothetical protein
MRNRFLSQHRKIHDIGSPFEENIPPYHSRELEFSKEKINSVPVMNNSGIFTCISRPWWKLDSIVNYAIYIILYTETQLSAKDIYSMLRNYEKE